MTAPHAPLPPDLLVALDQLAEAAHRGAGALVALDFDGALAPLQDDPEASRALPVAVDALASLGVAAGLRLALISGRAVDDLADKAEVPDGTILIGSHGAQRGRWSDGALQRSDLTLEPEAAALHTRLREELDAALASSPGSGAHIEHKPASVVLHTRRADRQAAEQLTRTALALGDLDGVDAMQGKDVVELSVLRVTKGDALTDLRRELDVAALLYAGDDVTDERAFTVLLPQDVTIKVGSGDTAARFRVPDPEGLAEALAYLAEALGSR